MKLKEQKRCRGNGRKLFLLPQHGAICSGPQVVKLCVFFGLSGCAVALRSGTRAHAHVLPLDSSHIHKSLSLLPQIFSMNESPGREAVFCEITARHSRPCHYFELTKKSPRIF